MTNEDTSNAYVEGDTGYLLLRGRDGALRGRALVDADDFDEVARHRFHVHKRQVVRNIGPEHRKLPLDRIVLGLPPGAEWSVRHVNGDPLDCRRSNLVLGKALLARALDEDPAVAVLATQRAVARITGKRAPARVAA
jgi:hypothetical protein